MHGEIVNILSSLLPAQNGLLKKTRVIEMGDMSSRIVATSALYSQLLIAYQLGIGCFCLMCGFLHNNIK